MKYLKLAGLLMGLSVIWVSAQTAETFTLVKVSNFDGSITVDVLNPEKLVELRKDIVLENKLIRDAYANVTRDWRKSHDNITVKQTITFKDQKREVDVKVPPPPFPLKRPSPREIVQSGVYSTAEAAAERKAALEATLKTAGVKKTDEGGKDKDKDKAKPKAPAGGKKGAVKGEDVDLDQLFQSMMSELATLKADALASPGKAGGAKKAEPKSAR